MTHEGHDEAVRRLGAAIREGRACIIRSVDGNYVENLIKRVGTHLGKRSIIHYGTGGLADEGPTIATSEPEATRDRIAWAAEGVADPFAPPHEPEELAVYLSAPVWSDHEHYDVIGLVDLPTADGEQIGALHTLMTSRTLGDRTLRDGVSLIAVVEPARWNAFTVSGFAWDAGLPIIDWPRRDLDASQALAIARGGDPLAGIDFELLLGPPVGKADAE
jgi:hypothetical protein